MSVRDPNPVDGAKPRRALSNPSRATSDVEHVAGADIEVTFDTGLCIHSRFCVLQAPDVFKANTPGDWILPDGDECDRTRRRRT